MSKKITPSKLSLKQASAIETAMFATSECYQELADKSNGALGPKEIFSGIQDLVTAIRAYAKEKKVDITVHIPK